MSVHVGRWIQHVAFGMHPPRVVVIHPNPAVADALGQMLRLDGCTVVGVTTDATQAFEWCAQRRVSVVVAEVGLADKARLAVEASSADTTGTITARVEEGIQAGLRLIRSLQVLRPTVEVIVRTTWTTSRVRQQALAAGARLVTGPDISPPMLLARVLEGHRAYVDRLRSRPLVASAGIAALMPAVLGWSPDVAALLL